MERETLPLFVMGPVGASERHLEVPALKEQQSCSVDAACGRRCGKADLEEEASAVPSKKNNSSLPSQSVYPIVENGSGGLHSAGVDCPVPQQTCQQTFGTGIFMRGGEARGKEGEIASVRAREWRSTKVRGFLCGASRQQHEKEPLTSPVSPCHC